MCWRVKRWQQVTTRLDWTKVSIGLIPHYTLTKKSRLEKARLLIIPACRWCGSRQRLKEVKSWQVDATCSYHWLHALQERGVHLKGSFFGSVDVFFLIARSFTWAFCKVAGKQHGIIKYGAKLIIPLWCHHGCNGSYRARKEISLSPTFLKRFLELVESSC